MVSRFFNFEMGKKKNKGLKVHLPSKHRDEVQTSDINVSTDSVLAGKATKGAAHVSSLTIRGLMLCRGG